MLVRSLKVVAPTNTGYGFVDDATEPLLVSVKLIMYFIKFYIDVCSRCRLHKIVLRFIFYNIAKI